jgi:hypothetical protein
MPRRTRFLMSFGVVIVACGAYLWFFGVQTFFALEVRYMARKMPVVKKAPLELPDSSVSHAPGTKLSYFGCEFEVPWDDIDEAKSRIIGGNKAVIAFRSGNVVSVWSGSPREFVNTVLSSGKIAPETFRQIYGDEALKSDYVFHRIMLETTPYKITPFISQRAAISAAMLLLMKGISAPRGADSGIFAIRTAEFAGFQYGRPATPAVVNVELFADSGSLDFIFGQKVNGSTVISQADINRILQTLHKIPAGKVANTSLSRQLRN